MYWFMGFFFGLFVSCFEMRAMERKFFKKIDHLNEIILNLLKSKKDE